MNDQKVDKRLKEIEDEILLLSGHLSEAVEKKLGVVIGDLKDGLETFKKSVLEIPAQKGAPAAPSVELTKLQNDLESIRIRIGSKEFDTDDDNLAKRLNDVSGTIMKALAGLEKNLQAIPAKKGAPAAPLIELNKLQSDIEALLKNIGSEELDGDTDNLARRLENYSDIIMKGLVGLETTMQEAIEQTTATQDDVKNTLAVNLTTLNDAIENVRTTLTTDVEETLGAKIEEIKDFIGNISGELSAESGKVMDNLSAIEKNVKDSVNRNGANQEESGEVLLQNLSSLNEVAEKIQQMLTVGEDTTAGTEIIEIKNHIGILSVDLSNSSDTINEKLAALDNGICEITAVKSRIDELSEELSAGDGIIKEDIAALNSKIKNAADNTASQQEEIKSTLQADIGKLNDSAEIIRRMVTTDEEKYLGSLTTMIHETVGKLSEELPEIAGQLNNRLVNVFKNAQDNATQDMEKQEEIKKVLLYDLYKLNEASDAILHMCTTEEERPLGGEVIVMSDRVEQIAGQMPNITEKINNHSAQLDKISSEVMRMRWFVVGAVVISLIVLIASFIK